MFKKKNKKKRDPEKKKSPSVGLGRQAKNAIFVILLLALAFLNIVSFFHKAGVVGEYFLKFVDYFVGAAKYLTPLIFIVAALAILARLKKPLWATLAGVLLLIISVTGFLGIILREADGGGVLGRGMSRLFLKYLDWAGSFIVLGALFLVSLILVFNLSFGFLFRKKTPKKEEEKEEEAQLALKFNHKPKFLSRFPRRETGIFKHPIFRLKKLPTEEIGASEEKGEDEGEKKSMYQGASEKGYQFPPLELLTQELKDVKTIKKSEIKAKMETIKETLENFGIDVSMGEVSVGPTVTQYTLKPAKGIRLSQIVALQNDLALALASHPLRIEAPIPGKAWVGIEVPNKDPHLVRLRNLLEDPRYQKVKSYLTICLGRDVSGAPYYDDLEKMPHLLIAGSTGSGKSVAIHNILVNFLYQNSPQTLKLILIDPKRVELTVYNNIPHLLTPVITNPKKAISALKWAISEMERRYELLAEVKSRDIFSYNEWVRKESKKDFSPEKEKPTPLPFIVIVIDELADIMASYGRDLEAAVVRLAQMARAVGIHLILSTQRPSVEVITGLIKANITHRIAFQVASQVDSRTILDMAGAEKLLGNGDMLYQRGDSSKPRRLQGVYVSEREVKRVTDFLKKQVKEEAPELVLPAESGASDIFKDYDYDDELYPEAKKLVIEAGKASATLLQRRLRVGYTRAARLLDMLEKESIIGPSRGSKPREVLVKKENEF